MEHKNNVFDRRNVKLEDMLKEGYIPFLEGRPIRKTIIGEDDITNLIIALHTVDDVGDVMKSV